MSASSVWSACADPRPARVSAKLRLSIISLSASAESGRWLELRERLTLDVLPTPRWLWMDEGDKGRGGTGCRPWLLFARDDKDEREFLRNNDTDLLVPGVVRILTPECCDFAAESVVPADVLERIDRASTSAPRRFRSGIRDQLGPSPSRLRLPSDEGDVSGGSRGGRCRLRVSVLSSKPLKASISLRPSASTNSISCRICCAVCRFWSSKTSCILIGDASFSPGPSSVPDIRAVNEEGGVAVAKRRKLRVVDRDVLPVKLCGSKELLPGLELNEVSYAVREVSVRMEASLPFRDSARTSTGRRKDVDEFIENKDEASLAADDWLPLPLVPGLEEDWRRLARRKIVDTVEDIDVFLRREGLRFTWN
jgi:hypothetical protein